MPQPPEITKALEVLQVEYAELSAKLLADRNQSRVAGGAVGVFSQSEFLNLMALNRQRDRLASVIGNLTAYYANH